MSVNPLRRARLERGITLEEVTSRTCLSPRIVQLLDNGQFAQLPGGLYARSYVRTFAAVVGLNPENVLNELGERLPLEQDPIPVWRHNMRYSMPPVMQDATDLAELMKAAVGTRLSAEAMPRLRMPMSIGVTASWNHRTWRLVAAAVDAIILLALYAAVVRLTAWTADLSVREVLSAAGLAVAAVCALVSLPYFLILGSLSGRPLGRVLRGASSAQKEPGEDDGMRWESHPDRVGAGC